VRCKNALSKVLVVSCIFQCLTSLVIPPARMATVRRKVAYFYDGKRNSFVFEEESCS